MVSGSGDRDFHEMGVSREGMLSLVALQSEQNGESGNQ